MRARRGWARSPVQGMRLAAAFMALAALVAGGCERGGAGGGTADGGGGADQPGADQAGPDQAGAAAEASGGIEVVAPWVRPAEPIPGDTVPVNSAGYMEIRNRSGAPDRLLEVDFPGVRMVEVHRSWMDGGVARMEPLDSLVVPAGGAVNLQPGGIHLMIMGVGEALVPGDTVRFTLRFRNGGAVPVRAPVQHLPPGG